MCGRYQIIADLREVAEAMGAEADPSLLDAPQRYNIAPTQPVPIVRERGRRRRLDLVRWGLVPSWVKRLEDLKSNLVNARSDTAATKPAFRSAMKYRRCLVPATGFYEWQRRDGQKQPHLIGMSDGRPFAFAGLWEHWQDAAGNELESCTILTTEPNEMLADIHDRMPAILPETGYARWLDSDQQDPAAVQDLLRPYPAEEMAAVAVSTYLNSPRHEGPKCAEPLTA